MYVPVVDIARVPQDPVPTGGEGNASRSLHAATPHDVILNLGNSTARWAGKKPLGLCQGIWVSPSAAKAPGRLS